MKPAWLFLGITGAVLEAVILAGCGGTGVDNRTGDDGGVDQAAAVVEAEWLVVDLGTGVAEPRFAIDDLATNPVYRTNRLVLRRVRATGTMIGSDPGGRWAHDDEPRSSVAMNPYFIGAFELTRGQWRHLSASTPWRDPAAPTTFAGLADDDHLPVCGLSLDQLEGVCATWTRAGRWSVPDARQWEGACRAGTTTAFSWGDQTDEATVARFAVVSLTAAGVEGPWPVGRREANAAGLYDLHGNVWEWTTDSGLRGGSWHDGLPLARSANRLPMDHATSHVLAGARLIYAP